MQTFLGAMGRRITEVTAMQKLLAGAVAAVLLSLMLKTAVFKITVARIEHQRVQIAEQMTSPNGDVSFAAWKRAFNWNRYIADKKSMAREPFVGLFINDSWLGVEFLPDYDL